MVLLCILMFKLNRPHKLAVLLLSTICLNSATLKSIPFGGGIYILSNCFIISELPYILKHYRKIKRTIIYTCMSIFLLSFIIIYINSPHYYLSLSQLLRLIIIEGVGKYFAMCYAFICIISEQDLKPIIKVSFWGLVVLTIFGLLNLITRHAIFIDTVGAHQEVSVTMANLGSKFTYSDRFRVQAMFMNPFDYGYICILLLLLHLFAYFKNLIQRKYLYISVICCLFGVFFCGCRTNILCFFIGIFFFVLTAFKISRLLKYSIIGIISFLFIYSSFPVIQEKVDGMFTIFDTNTTYSGSSIDMRILQYTTVFHYISGYELFGRGIDFFLIDLGWKDGRDGLVDKDLYGLEGVAMNIILERGIIGLIFYISIYFILLRFIIINRYIDKLTASLCLSILATYIVFANATGELSSVYPTLLIVGMGISLLYRKKQIKKLNY